MAGNKNESGTPVTYTIGDGTIDYGKEYEVKMCALLSLRCAGHKTVRNTWVALNVDRCGAFDDLVFCVETKDGRNLTYLIQLKQGMESGYLPAREFKTKKGSYYLKKCYQSIVEIKNAIDNAGDQGSEIINHLRGCQDAMVFILFTNRETTECDFLNNVSQNSDFETKWLLHQFIGTGGSVSQLNYGKLDLKIAKDLTNLMEQKFFLFTNQIQIDKADAAIATAIESLIKPMKLPKRQLTKIVQKFILFVTDWSKGELGGHYPLSKDHVFRVLFEQTLQPYMVKFQQAQACEPFQLTIWNELIEDKSVTVIEEDGLVLDFLKRFVYDKINKYRGDPKNRNLWKNHPENIRKEILRLVRRYKQIRTCDAYECLWKSGQVPLVLKGDRSRHFSDILHLIKVFQHNFPVIILTTSVNQLSSTQFPKSFFDLRDLNQKLQGEILTHPVKLQGRSSIKLSGFVVGQMFHLVTVRDIIYILTNNYNVGNVYEPLPDTFVERSLEKVWLEAEALQELTEEMFLIKCKSLEHLELLFGQRRVFVDSSRIVLWKNKANDSVEVRIVIFVDGHSLKQMEVFGATINKTTHLLVLHEEKIEWVKSFGTTKNIAEFRAIPDNRVYSDVNQILKEVPVRANLISACPGMGKSVLMNYLAHDAPTDWWVLKINLLDYVDYYKTKSFENTHSEPSDHLNYFGDRIFQKQGSNTELSKNIFKKYLLAKKVMVILDAFDEIPVPSQSNAQQMIKSICDSNKFTFITTRPNYQTQLEELLNTFSVNIKMFTKHDQKTFLTIYYSKVDAESTSRQVEAFADVLLAAAKENLHDNDQELTGVPLQTKLLAQVFTEDYEKFRETGRFENTRFDLLYLYNHFLHQKIRILCGKFGNTSEDLLVQYKSYRTLYALRLLFVKEDLEELKIDEQLEQVLKLFPNILQLMQKDDIVVAQNESAVTFVHRIFAEYLSAEWLAENINSEFKDVAKKLAQEIFDPAFGVVRSIFDRMVAKDCPLLLTIIGHRRFKAKQILTSNPEALDDLDRCGRSFLHLIAAWGVYHPPALKTDKEVRRLQQLILKDAAKEILQLVPCNKLNNREDDLLGYTPLDYAVASGSLHIANYICSRLAYNNASSFFKEDNLNYTFDYAVKLNYCSLMPAIARHAALGLLRAMFYLQGNIAQQIGTNNLRRLAVSGNVRDLPILIKDEPNINEADSIGYTLLHAAVMYGHVIMTNLLLEKGADANIKDANGHTPLHWATIKGYSKIANLLLLNYADVDAADSDGRTALHLAATVAENKDRNEIVSNLLKNKATVTVRDVRGKTPFHYCVDYKQLEILKLLLQSEGSSPSALSEMFSLKDDSGTALLHNTARLGFADALSLFLPHNPDLEIREVHGRTVLHIAAHEGQTDIVNLMLPAKGTNGIHLADTKSPNFASPLSRANIEAVDDSKLTALHMASCNGHTDTVKALLANGANPELKDEFNRTSLICAAQNGHEETTAVLLSNGSKLEERDERDRTALIATARNGHTELVKFLLSAGADIEAINDEHMSALHFAACSGHEDITKLLLACGATCDKQDICHRSPLICAATSGCVATVDLLLRKGVNMETKATAGMSALAWAAWLGHKETVTLLLQKGARLDVRDVLANTPLTRAAYHGHVDVVALLLSKGADLEAKDRTGCNALYNAAWNGCTTTVGLLLSNGANIEAKSRIGMTALIAAARNGYPATVDLLLSNGAWIEAKDEEDMTALHWAARNGHAEATQLLLSKGADLNTINIYEWCPLLSAADNGNSDTVALLLTNGANIEATDDEGTTALHCAARSGHTEIINLLISNGASMEAKDKGGGRPLHCAVYGGHFKATNELLRNGADVNATDDVKMSALHWAVHKSHPLVADLLISFGANLEAKNKDGRTPLLFVAEDGDHKAVLYLLAQRADLEARDANNRSALHLATIVGFAGLSELLVTNGTELEAQDEFGNTALIYAARLFSSTIATMLLSKGANVQTRNNDGEAAIHWAVRDGCWEVVELLISHGANLEAKANNGKTPLMYAAQIGDDDTATLLLSKGANIEARDVEGKTALLWAVIENMAPTVELVLLEGATLEETDDDGRSALLWAIIQGHADMLNLLLANGANVKTTDNEAMGALHLAAWNGHKTIMKILVERMPNLETKNVYGQTPLLCAAQRGHSDSVKVLLTAGACVDATDNGAKNALHWAARNGYVDTVKLLLDYPTNLNMFAGNGQWDLANTIAPIFNAKDKFGKTALIYASSAGHAHVINELLSRGADLEAVDEENKTPLHWAAWHGHAEATEGLLNWGANLEAVDMRGQTALIHAAQEGHADTAAVLVSKGADMERKDNKGMNALLWALNNDHVVVANLILAEGADAEVKGSVLHHAVVKGFTETVKLLLSNKVKLDKTDYIGFPALMYAIEGGHYAIVNLLLSQGVDVEAEYIQGGAPLRFAASLGHKEIVDLMLSKGAKFERKGRHEITALMEGARYGHADVVRLLLSKGAQVEAKDNEDGTALLRASCGGHAEVVNLLLANGADLEATGKDGASALVVAAREGDVSTVSALLDKGADVTVRDKSGMSALDWAKKNGCDEAAALLATQQKGLKQYCVIC